MFERASITFPETKDRGFDVGRLFDVMLYYRNVDFVVDRFAFQHLVSFFGFEGAATLLTYPSLSASVTTEVSVAVAQDRSGLTSYRMANLKDIGYKGETREKPSILDVFHRMVTEVEESTSRRDVRRFMKNIRITTLDKITGQFPDAPDLFLSLLRDPIMMRLAVMFIAERDGGTINTALLQSVSVEVYRVEGEFYFLSNIPLNNIVGLEWVDWSEAMLVVGSYVFDLLLARSRSADLIGRSLSARIGERLIDHSILRAVGSENKRTAFEEFIFKDSKPFGRAVAEKKISLKEALGILDDTRKFREWLTGLPPDEDIIAEFHKALAQDTILEKLPAKAARYALFTGAGLAADVAALGGIGTAAGLMASAFDAFVLDGIVRGWRPNSFVNTIERRVIMKGA